MAEPSDLDAHRETITQRINALSKDLEHTAGGSQALYEWTELHHKLLEIVREKQGLHYAETELFGKLMLANARLSNTWEEYKGRCLMLEEQLGYYHPKK